MRRIELEAPAGQSRESQRQRQQLEGPDRIQQVQRARRWRGCQDLIAGLDVSKATLLYRDEEKKSVSRLANLELHTGALGGEAPVPISMEFDYNEGGPDPSLHLVTEAQVRMPSDSSQVEVSDLIMKGPKFSVRAPELRVDTQAETLAPATLEVKYGDLPLKVTATGEKSSSAPAS